jgi:urease accessory protein
VLEVTERVGVTSDVQIDEVLVLDHQQRKKGRLKVTAKSGKTVGLFLERGKTLPIGEVLRSNGGQHLLIEGAEETVVTASTSDWSAFSRACYHLGNRHVTLQVGECWLRFKPDYVLEDLVKRFGLKTSEENVVFEPEDGAYTASGHSHHHEH